MTRVRVVIVLGLFALGPWLGAAGAGAQILPTSTTDPPSTTTTSRPRPSTTATTTASSTTSRPRSTTSTTEPPSTTITTIAPPASLVPEEEAPPEIADQGNLPRFFAVLSVLGFAVAIGMIGSRFWQTRAEDARLAERAREILSRRALRQSSRRPPP